MDARFDHAAEAFRDRGGILRMSEALRAGLPRSALYAMLEAGELERLGRGVYKLASSPPLSNPDLVTVAKRVPKGVACLITALDFHGLTTQIPRSVHVAIRKGQTRPRVTSPRIQTYWFSGEAFDRGIETHQIDGCDVRVYCAEKTIADIFKFRGRIGKDVAIDALRRWSSRRGADFGRVLEFARICRVERVMRPYLETLA